MITVLRHYLDPDDQTKPNAFAIGIGKTLVAIAKIHVQVDDERLKALKKLTGKLPAAPFDLTEKNKALLRHFDDERNVAALFALVDDLLEEAKRRLACELGKEADVRSALWAMKQSEDRMEELLRTGVRGLNRRGQAEFRTLAEKAIQENGVLQALGRKVLAGLGDSARQSWFPVRVLLSESRTGSEAVDVANSMAH